jgi:molybdopterin-biosynthesis enzyme MoeA-like protein
MHAEIFAIGTELLMGELTDANSAWLAARLPALGIELRRSPCWGIISPPLATPWPRLCKGLT